MARERLNHTPEGKTLVFTDHIMYEFKMLQMTYLFLGVPFYSGWVGNALIESFSIHARNLLEFFGGTGSESDEKVCAYHFTNSSYKAFPNGEIPGELFGKLQAQIAHLSYQRTKDNADKIGPKDRKELLEFLNKEIEHFAAHLKLPFREKWPGSMKLDASSIAALPAQSFTGYVDTSTLQPYTITLNSSLAPYRTNEPSDKK